MSTASPVVHTVTIPEGRLLELASKEHLFDELLADNRSLQDQVKRLREERRDGESPMKFPPPASTMTLSNGGRPAVMRVLDGDGSPVSTSDSAG